MKKLFAIVIVSGCLAAWAGQSDTKSAALPSYKVAKAQCLKQDASLKGKALRNCVHEKRKVASQ